jgi:predicted RNA-binding Zn-ribbon protein involved in translation (DUF1610 family)
VTVVCPICKSSAQELPAGDATAFHCPIHGDFKVADNVLAKAKNYTRDQWEAGRWAGECAGAVGRAKRLSSLDPKQ